MEISYIVEFLVLLGVFLIEFANLFRCKDGLLLGLFILSGAEGLLRHGRRSLCMRSLVLLWMLLVTIIIWIIVLVVVRVIIHLLMSLGHLGVPLIALATVVLPSLSVHVGLGRRLVIAS